MNPQGFSVMIPWSYYHLKWPFTVYRGPNSKIQDRAGDTLTPLLPDHKWLIVNFDASIRWWQGLK